MLLHNVNLLIKICITITIDEFNVLAFIYSTRLNDEALFALGIISFSNETPPGCESNLMFCYIIEQRFQLLCTLAVDA